MESTAQKGICLVIFFLTTMLAGSIPILLFSQCRRKMTSKRGLAITSLFNCFAGGVFLATCLLNLLVEGLEQYEEYKVVASFDCEYPLFHLAIGLGFFAVAFVERLAVLMSKHGLKNGGDPQNSAPGGEKRENTERFTGHSGVIAITIFLALSFHTIFDGLAVGLQETETDIWTTTIAISIHKTIVAVSLGLELAMASPGKPWRALIFLFVFALMAPLGVAIGMGVTSGNLNVRAHLLTSGILQGVATGSFLYVTFFEVLGEELGHRSSVLKIFITLLGFAAMAVAKIWDTD